MRQADVTKRPEEAKILYPFQVEATERIMPYLLDNPRNENIIYQLPTGGGKTVIFSEIVRRYMLYTGKRVLLLTHRIELLKQTARALEEVGVNCMLIVSEIGDIPDQENFQCFLAMVETLNNRLKDDTGYLSDISLVIVDEAHYNSFRKIFHYFKDITILGVTATPLSSNINLPLRDNYQRLIIGESIRELIAKDYLSDATTYTYDVHLGGLKVGIDGDYTVSSLDRIYLGDDMQDKLVRAYEEKALNTKTLIFNSSISTSKSVAELFEKAGYEIRHLDSTHSKEDRKETLRWFRENPMAIITSVGILTTGFDEPTVETIILNRATRSLTLYHQMMGRGSRRLPNKHRFSVIDLGNNARRLGLWQDYIDWLDVFHNPGRFLEALQEREQLLEDGLFYSLSDEFMKQFPNTTDFSFDMETTYRKLVLSGKRTIEAVELSMNDHFKRIIENTSDLYEAIDLLNLLQEEIQYRLRVYTRCLAKASRNYLQYLYEDYNEKIKLRIRRELYR